MDFDLGKRENLLKEELAKNESETKRWENFKQENIQANENMEMFLKKLNIEVLVPIAGNKAFIPGYLYHTNEILVGHYNGMFSKCSTTKAQEIVKYRLNLAKEHLEGLRKEKEMFENKLNIPHTDGILPNEMQQEIIEEYDEEKEKIWREEHKKRLREYKLNIKEKNENENDVENEKTHENIMNMLDELELIEELDQEFENLDIHDTDMIEKLLSGEIKLPPEKHRISHENKNSNIIVGSNTEKEENSKYKNDDCSMEDVYQKYKIEKFTEYQENNDFTNNNNIPNTEDFEREENAEDTDSDDDDDDDDDYEKFDKIKKDIEHFSIKDKIKFYKMKIIEIEKNIKELKITNVYEYNKKLNLLEFLDYLNDQVEMLKDEKQQDNNGLNEEFISNGKMDKKPMKKKISFALEDDIHFIEKDNRIEDNLINETQNEKDVIVLDFNVLPKKDQQTDVVIDRKTAVMNEVEKNRTFVFEKQSQQDFDLIGKIMNESNENKTLFIKYKHSEKIFNYPGYENNDKETNLIGSPADIYKFYGKNNEINCSDSNQLEITSKNKENIIKHENDSSENIINKISNEKVNTNLQNISNETFECVKQNVNNVNTVSDLKLKNQIPNKPKDDEQKKNKRITKSILKNKDAVKLETHTIEKKSKKKRSNKEEFNHFNVIVGDIVENPSLEIGPEPLPNGNFIDTHAPKKRISRFKQMRDNLRIKS